MADYSVLSNFGVRYFLEPMVAGSPDDRVTTDNQNFKTNAKLKTEYEITDVLSCNVGEINKDVKTFKTLNGDGWDSAVPLGQNMSEGNMSLIRTGTGAYSSSGTATFDRLRKWMLESAQAGGSTAARCLVEVVPRGGTVYEATGYIVVPTKFNPGEKNTSDGQEYDISFQAYGAPIIATSVATSSTSGEAFTLNAGA